MFKTLFLLCVFSIVLRADEPNLITCLQLIENGRADSVRIILAGISNKDSAPYMFLDALLTEDSQAIVKFEKLIAQHPGYKYKDAALFRLHSYYYAIGSYTKAKEIAENLKNTHPKSPYLKQLDKMVYSDEPEVVNTVEDKPVRPVELKSNFYSLQAGAFLNRQNADNLLKTLAGKGYESFLDEKEIGGSVFFIVLVGRFDSENDAQKIKKQLDAEIKTESKIVSMSL